MPSMLSMVGFSLYILADTFFISLAEGANGITVLNLCLPYYDLIYAFGLMAGNGAATKFAILKAQGNKEYKEYFSLAIKWILLLSIPFMLTGIICPREALMLMGGDTLIANLGAPYARIFMIFTPAFALSFMFLAFIRNDNDPGLAMRANLTGTLINIVFDYVFIFVFGWSMTGAALATGIAPLISSCICLKHFKNPENTLRIIKTKSSGFKEDVYKFIDACKLGISSFVVQMSEGVITTEFNFLCLKYASNVGIASFGIISNYSIMVLSVFSGIAEGAQPLISKAYGEGEKEAQIKLLKYGLVTGEIIALIVFAAGLLVPGLLTGLFNSEGSAELAAIAEPGLKLYFSGFIFASLNIVLSSYFSASEQPQKAAVISVLRGFAAIVPAALILSYLFGISGLWISFAAAEALALISGIAVSLRQK